MVAQNQIDSNRIKRFPNSHDFLSACLVLFLSRGAILEGPLVAVFTRLSSISSSPSVKLPLVLPRNDLLPSLRVLLNGNVPWKLSTSERSLPSSCLSSASARSSFVLNLPTCDCGDVGLMCHLSHLVY